MILFTLIRTFQCENTNILKDGVEGGDQKLSPRTPSSTNSFIFLFRSKSMQFPSFTINIYRLCKVLCCWVESCRSLLLRSDEKDKVFNINMYRILCCILSWPYQTTDYVVQDEINLILTLRYFSIQFSKVIS